MSNGATTMICLEITLEVFYVYFDLRSVSFELKVYLLVHSATSEQLCKHDQWSDRTSGALTAHDCLFSLCKTPAYLPVISSGVTTWVSIPLISAISYWSPNCWEPSSTVVLNTPPKVSKPSLCVLISDLYDGSLYDLAHLCFCSSARMHSSGGVRNGYYLPGQIGYGQDRRFRVGHTASAAACRWRGWSSSVSLSVITTVCLSVLSYCVFYLRSM